MTYLQRRIVCLLMDAAGGASAGTSAVYALRHEWRPAADLFVLAIALFSAIRSPYSWER